jgi:hypothetical protein
LLHDRHRGRRGFVIGNGPSLRIDDLTRIHTHGDISIASNKIFLAFDRTPWRPDYFTIVDILVWKKLRTSLHHHVDLVHLPDTFGIGNAQCRVRQWHCLGLAGEIQGPEPQFSDDITRGIYGGCSVTYENLQLAVHLGLNPIYLIGCDHYYHGEEGSCRDNAIVAGIVSSHFAPDYRTPGEVVNPAPLQSMERAFGQALLYALQHGIQIMNATRGGRLDVFPRTNLDEVLQDESHA